MREESESQEAISSNLSIRLQDFFSYKWSVVGRGRTNHWYYFMPATACCASIWKTCLGYQMYLKSHTHCSVKFPFQMFTKWNQGAGSLEWLLWVTSIWTFTYTTCFPKERVCSCTLEENYFFPLSQALFTAFIYINGRGWMHTLAKW